MRLATALPLTLTLLLTSGCPRDLCAGGGCGDGGGEEPTDGCVRLGGVCGAATCCATDSSGNALSCDADAGVCRTSCGQLASSCGAAAPCCAGSSGGYSLACVQDACAQCIGRGQSCADAETGCCPGSSCLAYYVGGYTYYHCE